MLTGYTDHLPDDVLLDAGILGHSVSGVFKKIGVTSGGTSFDPGITDKDIEFDGMRNTIKGLERRVGFNAIIKAKLREFGGSTTGGQIGLVEPGSSEAAADGSGTIVITPKAAGPLYQAGEYLDDIRWIIERASGGFAVLLFPVARFTKYSLASNDKDESLIDCEIKAVTDPAVDLGTAPYFIELRTAMPS